MDKLLPSAAYFEGHFPGQPVLPGVTQLALAAQAIARRAGGGALSAVHHVRLRRLVLPGEELRLTTREADGRIRFELKRDTTIVTNGELALSESLSQWESSAPDAMRAMKHPPIETLLPHRSPMRFVERVFDCTAERIVCEASIPSACPLAHVGAAPAIVAIEAAAQAAAVREALRRIGSGERNAVPSGYLVSLRDVELAVATIPVDAPLVVVVRLQFMALPLSTYVVDVFYQGRPVLRGRIGTFLTDA